ncbi:hypothetical protein Sar04_39420 [Salinispora arenicola]|uniref:Uncharacterized protein n=1 Tax=Salinispora arenicola TaxID=168697 RepID=A0ABQ4JYG8_SALAC|nr:hypothetical protein [Salinispora arenicola]GIM87206.1 hypothetical protein Sar04_39420 [Salinispora arenicola]
MSYRLSNGTLEHRFVDDTTGQIVTDNWGGTLAPQPVGYATRAAR